MADIDANNRETRLKKIFPDKYEEYVKIYNYVSDSADKLTIKKYISSDLFSNDNYYNFINNNISKNNNFLKKKKNLFMEGIEKIRNNQDTITYMKYDNTYCVKYDESSENITYPDYFDRLIYLDIPELKMQSEETKYHIKQESQSMKTQYDSAFPEGKYSFNKDDNSYDVWVAFANAYMGGGIFSYGFVQEEIMYLEIPQISALLHELGVLANKDTYKGNYDTSKFRTRVKNPLTIYSPKVISEACPTPILVQNVTRVLDIKAYGRGEKPSNLENMNNYYSIIKKQSGINVLAIAAPNVKPSLKDKGYTKQYHNFKNIVLYTKFPESYAKFIIYDLFNTIVKGFELAIMSSPPNTPITVHSGKLGSGDFKNDPVLVGALHHIAKLYINHIYKIIFDVKLWYYGDSETKDTINLFNSALDDIYEKDISIKRILNILYDKYKEYAAKTTNKKPKTTNKILKSILKSQQKSYPKKTLSWDPLLQD